MASLYEIEKQIAAIRALTISLAESVGINPDEYLTDDNTV